MSGIAHVNVNVMFKSEHMYKEHKDCDARHVSSKCENLIIFFKLMFRSAMYLNRIHF